MGFKLIGVNQKEVYKDIVCPICSDLVEVPLVSKICSHIFCELCTKNNFDNFLRCPLDGTEVNTSTLSKEIPEKIKTQLRQITVKCRNDGCQEKLKLVNIREHEEFECWYSPTQCSKCGKVLPLMDQRIHSLTCNMFSLPTFTPKASPQVSPTTSPTPTEGQGSLTPGTPGSSGGSTTGNKTSSSCPKAMQWILAKDKKKKKQKKKKTGLCVIA